MTNDEATPLSAILKALLQQTGLQKKVTEYAVLEYWEEVVGEFAAKATTAKALESGRLTVHLVSPVWRSEIHLRKQEIIRQLNEKIGSAVVTEIVVK